MRRSTAASSAAGVVAALALVTADVLEHGVLRRADWQLHERIDVDLHGGPARMGATLLALAGQRGLLVIPLLALAVLAARRHRTVRPVVVAVIVLVGLALAVGVFKAAVGRVAPGAGHDAVHVGGRSYPSGHAINAIVCWGMALEFAASIGDRAHRLLPRRRRWIITGVLAASAGIGMTALDYHWLTDVIAGWLLGLLVFGAVLAFGPVHRARRPALSPAAPPGSARHAPSA